MTSQGSAHGRFQRCNVKRWSSGEMALRWTAAGMLEAEKQFRKVIGYRDLAKLALAVEREISGPKGRPSAGARRWPSLRPEVVG